MYILSIYLHILLICPSVVALFDLSSVGIALVLGFDSRRVLVIFLFTTASRTALGPTQTPIQWIPGALSLGFKRLGREADHSPPSSAEVKECVELYLHSPSTPSWRGAQLKRRDNFTFTFVFISYVIRRSRWELGAEPRLPWLLLLLFYHHRTETEREPWPLTDSLTIRNSYRHEASGMWRR
jgi:hypothetical protein